MNYLGMNKTQVDIEISSMLTDEKGMLIKEWHTFPAGTSVIEAKEWLDSYFKGENPRPLSNTGVIDLNG